METTKEFKMIFPGEEEERVVIYEDGHYYFSDFLYTDGRRKSRIIRNAPLPKWVRETLKKGEAVEVENLEICKGDRGIYVIIKGKAVKSHTEERETPIKWEFSDDTYSRGKMSGVDVYEWTIYDNGYSKKGRCIGRIGRELLWGITHEAMAEFEKTKPEEVREYREEFIGTTHEVRLIDDTSISVTKIEVYKPHKDGFWFSKRIDRETGELHWEKCKLTNIDGNKSVKSEPQRLKVVSMEEIDRQRETYESKYESEDGMRMCHDWDTFEYIDYNVLAEDGNTYKVTKCIRIN